MISSEDLESKEIRLCEWLKTKMPSAQELSIMSLQRAPSGMSHETYFFDLQWQESGRAKLRGIIDDCYKNSKGVGYGTI